jgi:hypothetical protein
MTTETAKTLERIKVGDRVWLRGEGRYGRALGTIGKILPTQVVLAERDERYRRSDGRRIGFAFYRCITAVATPEEVERWEAEQAEKRREAEAHLAGRRRIEDKRLELTGLFGENFYVGESNDPDVPPWEVHGFLSEEGVRRLAELLKGERLA